MNIKALFDDYERKARFIPSFITIFPIIIWIYCWFPMIQTVGWAIIVPILNLGIALPLTGVARDLGKKVEKRLIEKHGALPATLLLRHDNTFLNNYTKERYRKNLEKRNEVDLPTLEEEKENPKEANQKLSSCIDFLIKKFRDKEEYPLVFNENKHYGYVRNLLGLKPVGLPLCLVGLISHLLFFISVGPFIMNLSSNDPFKLVSFLITLILFLFWCFYVTSSSVYKAGENYGRALLENCEDI